MPKQPQILEIRQAGEVIFINGGTRIEFENKDKADFFLMDLVLQLMSDGRS